jgi:hypothetical protein
MAVKRRPAAMGPEEIIFIERTPEEDEQAFQRTLKRLGLTFAELKRQAREQNFSSMDAQDFWLLSGKYHAEA